MIIREYRAEDETAWVRCRLISFLDSSYFDDIRKEKDTYENPSISLVAEENGAIVGFIEVEYEVEGGEVCYLKGDKGAVIWNMGVLPEYRSKGVAGKLFQNVKEILAEQGIKRYEAWTQDDIEANHWYIKQGFIMREAYLNAFIKGTKQDDIMKKYINMKEIGEIYGIRNLNFEAPIERKEELLPICYRLHEVRVYELSIENIFNVKEITDRVVKSQITLDIMNALPKWFSPPEDIITKSNTHKEFPFFAVFDHDKVIGFVALKIHNTFTVEIYTIGILEEYHRKGLGYKLLKACEKYGKVCGYKYITVKTLDESADYEPYNSTRAFYIKNGFIPLEVLQTFWNDENPCLFLVKYIM